MSDSSAARSSSSSPSPATPSPTPSPTPGAAARTARARIIALVVVKLVFVGLVVVRAMRWVQAGGGRPAPGPKPGRFAMANPPTILDHGLNIAIVGTAIAAIVVGFAAFRSITRRG